MDEQIPKNPNLTLQDIEKGIKKKKPRKKWRPIFFGIKLVILFTLLTVLVFYSLNAPAYLKRGKYQNNPAQFNQLLNVPKENPADLTLPTLYPVDLADNSIYIPKISVKAPITWEVDENNMMEELKNGVVQYRDTALPGQIGNVFIFGHSSNYIWVNSEYNYIFALLENVEIGDNIYITYQNKQYVYEIDEKKVVRPSQVEVMDPTPRETITLMTCVPVGTSINRLIVTGKQISPKQNEEAMTILPRFGN